ncbi:hypothetical protein GCM10022419_006180 [Nonomuraea rosea]|uniref:Uncharacterized protein n=1 Tax=Nonomuraea rosea TaxID=638574 RepID=A0ABP6V8B6_9ACTN
MDMFCLPGTSNRASAPTMAPMTTAETIAPIMCSSPRDVHMSWGDLPSEQANYPVEGGGPYRASDEPPPPHSAGSATARQDTLTHPCIGRLALRKG